MPPMVTGIGSEAAEPPKNGLAGVWGVAFHDLHQSLDSDMTAGALPASGSDRWLTEATQWLGEAAEPASAPVQHRQ